MLAPMLGPAVFKVHVESVACVVKSLNVTHIVVYKRHSLLGNQAQPVNSYPNQGCCTGRTLVHPLRLT